MSHADRPSAMLPIGLQSRLEWLRSRLWFIPGLFVLAATAGAFSLVPLDRLVDQEVSGDFSGVLFAGGPESARLVLSTIAAAMLTFTGLVFSVTMLVLQLASSQLSPRVMRTFLRDRVSQTILGLFVATFLYSLLILRDVRAPAVGSAFVPAISVTVAYLLLVASVGAFVIYIHHMAQSIRAVSVLRSVGAETRRAIARLYPEGTGDDPSDPEKALPVRAPDRMIVMRRAPGVVTSVDDEGLFHMAVQHRLTVAILHHVGDFVPEDAPLMAVWSRSPAAVPDDLPEGRLAGTVEIGPERTMTQDAAFGFRQIVDIGAKALSPGINDPTTAVQALDQVHDLLRRLARRRFPSPFRLDEAGEIVLHLPRPGWPDYVALAIDEIRQYGIGSIQVARRLRHLLLDVRSVAPPSRHGPLDRQLRHLDEGIAAAFAITDDRVAAAQPSASGQGPG